MKRGFIIAVLVVLAFGAIIVTRLPASWVVPAPPAQIACTAVDGSVWNGVCTGLIYQGQSIGDVRWTLNPVKLLTGTVAAHVVLNRGPVTDPTRVEGDIESGFNGRNITARNVKADIHLNDPLIVAQLKQQYLGSVHTDLRLARLTGNQLREIQGVVEGHDLSETGSQGASFGSYSVTFPGGPGEQVGQLRDLGKGPLAVEGTLRVVAGPGIEVHGLVAPRAGASQDLQNALRYLGSPDSQGRREFGPISYGF